MGRGKWPDDYRLKHLLPMPLYLLLCDKRGAILYPLDRSRADLSIALICLFVFLR